MDSPILDYTQEINLTTSNFKLGRYKTGGRIVIGRPQDQQVEILCEEDDLGSCLAAGPATLPVLRRVPSGDAMLMAPVGPSARVFAIAINYAAHGAEANAKPPVRPLIFYKAPSNFVAPGGSLDLNTDVTREFDYEGEIGVVIGRMCRHVPASAAHDVVAGICAVNDGSARDLTKLAAGDSIWPDWTAAKGLDNASGAGPVVDCNPDLLKALRDRTLTVTTRLNGTQVQHECMSKMIFSVEQIIATLSSYMTLMPGDIIATGTPAGIGAARGRFLQHGDHLEIEVSGLDPLSMRVG